MNKKIIGAILCVCIFVFGSIPALGAPPIDDLELDMEIISHIEKMLDEGNQTLGANIFITHGPVLQLYSKVNLLEGSENQMWLINLYLSRKLIRPLLIVKNIPIFVDNVSFTVEYKKDVRERSRFSYITASASVIWNNTSGVYEGITNYSFVNNKVHKVNVENMTGFFIFTRIQMVDRYQQFFRKLFQPAKFTFFGFFDKITYL
jgi:hypothetical protein